MSIFLIEKLKRDIASAHEQYEEALDKSELVTQFYLGYLHGLRSALLHVKESEAVSTATNKEFSYPYENISTGDGKHVYEDGKL